MGNCIRKCRHYDNDSIYAVSDIFDIQRSLDLQREHISIDSSYTESTIRSGHSIGQPPSVLSFQNENENDTVYIDSDVCLICLEQYDDEERKPIILPCGHILCTACVRIMAHKRRYKSIKCPVDREKHDIRQTEESDETYSATTTSAVNNFQISGINQMNDLQPQLQHLRLTNNIDPIPDYTPPSTP
ncbi:uncharacterized protein LOC134712323 isoform X2 [Mytilus trossulus]|uniref:uncharacterized protein LOC134712323 isoform X2 n=1 Tax=Mytilus trossulus TaxID=6551 RepID=UPI0030071E8F